jgi:hypothetical protein
MQGGSTPANQVSFPAALEALGLPPSLLAVVDVVDPTPQKPICQICWEKDHPGEVFDSVQQRRSAGLCKKHADEMRHKLQMARKARAEFKLAS